MNARLRRPFFSPAFSGYGLSEIPCDYSLFLPALILTTAVLSCLPGAPSAPGCLAASGRQARLRQAAAGAPASLRRTRWRGFGLSLRSDA
ncbi:TPA: hypothetical protein HH973_004486 [Escherichia coli]|nr:hypothetical protein [Escherichia coli]HCO1964402.1 hypothetical protein [Escherichia coli]